MLRRTALAFAALAAIAACPPRVPNPVDPASTPALASQPCPDDACVEKATTMLDGPEAAQGIELLRGACEADVSSGCHQLALAYWDGKGVTKSTVTAAEYLRKNCNRGFVESCLNLSVLFGEDPSIPKIYGQAAEILAEACSLLDDTPSLTGHLRADVLRSCNSLGMMFFNGTGVPQNPRRGEELLQKACDAEMWLACDNLGLFMVKLGRGEEAAALFTRACESDYGNACTNLGMAHMTATGVARDEAKGRELFERACGQSSGLGCFNLGICRQDGKGGPKDATAALAAFEMGCNLGFSAACQEAAAMKPAAPQ